MLQEMSVHVHILNFNYKNEDDYNHYLKDNFSMKP
jgi:hypothetical protein